MDHFYSELSRILKRYLSGRFRVPLMEETTEEVPPRLVEAGAPEGAIEATVDVIESLGAEAILHLNAGGVPMVAQVPEPIDLVSGASVRLGIRAVHRFDRESGARL